MLKIRIAAQNFKVAYDDMVAVSIPDLQLEGNTIAVLGHNGAGKSTLIKTMLGLLPPLTGNLTLYEINSGNSGTPTLLEPHRHMAFCPETGSVFEDISVEDYVRLWCRIKHNDANYFRKGGQRYIELLEVEPLLKKLGRELSKGQRRRVQTAIGFLTEPKLFLFDEPFDGLDVKKTEELAQIMRDAAGRMCFIVSSHRMDVVERLADQALVLCHGEVAAAGSLEEVSSQLAEQSLIISHLHDSESVLRAVAHEFKDFAVTKLGQQITVTGYDLKRNIIEDLVARVDQNGAVVSGVIPNLTDAMNYHLRKIR